MKDYKWYHNVASVVGTSACMGLFGTAATQSIVGTLVCGGVACLCAYVISKAKDVDMSSEVK